MVYQPFRTDDLRITWKEYLDWLSDYLDKNFSQIWLYFNFVEHHMQAIEQQLAKLTETAEVDDGRTKSV